MKSRIVISVVIIAVLAAVPMRASKVDRLDRESTHIAVGEIAMVEGYFGRSEAGEQLIFSRISLRVEKWLKGMPEAAVAFSVEGGVVGNLGLMVSDSPAFIQGEKIKAYLKKTAKGFELLEKQEAGQKAKKPRPPQPPDVLRDVRPLAFDDGSVSSEHGQQRRQYSSRRSKGLSRPACGSGA